MICMRMNFFLLLTLVSLNLEAAIDWSNPAVFCPEELFAKGEVCPDLSSVEDPYTDFPSTMPPAEIEEWKSRKTLDLSVCRNKEVLKRAKKFPEKYSAATIEVAWMTVDGSRSASEKLSAIQEASIKFEIPPQILIGALKQESLLSNLGISPDGGNFSCGISQINLQEWCQNLINMSESQKAALNWPSNISCDSEFLPNSIIRPFYEIALKNHPEKANYQLSAKDFANISLDQVIGGFPRAKSSLQHKRFSAALSFIKHCQDIPKAIEAKANALRILFDKYVPTSLKDNEIYQNGEHFHRLCNENYPSPYYPLHTGWLMAVAMYNAGPLQAKLAGYYFQKKSDEFPLINPQELIEALHWGGKYQAGTNNIVFYDLNKSTNNKLAQSWFKSCVVQRHIAKVIKHVTIPNNVLARSLEQGGCVQGEVPEYRKISSGTKSGFKI